MFGVGVLPTRAIVCRILLLLLIRSQSLRRMMTYLYRWRAEGRFAGRAGRFRTPCWRGTWTGFDGWIRGVRCEKCWYSCSIWWGHVQLEPAEFKHSWRWAQMTAALWEKATTKSILHLSKKKQARPWMISTCFEIHCVFVSGRYSVLSDCSRLFAVTFQRDQWMCMFIFS